MSAALHRGLTNFARIHLRPRAGSDAPIYRGFANIKVARRRVLEFRAADDSKRYLLDSHVASKDGAGRRATIYSSEEGSQEWKIIEPERDTNRQSFPVDNLNLLESIRHAFFENVVTHFLPAQYPHSVADGYARFSLLAFSASVAGSAAMVLSTQTLLLAVGVVGQSAAASGSASIMAGALNWVLKDGIGQLGGVIFASKMGEMQKFDSDPKRWRMLAALSLDGASLLEILSPLVWSSWVLPVACVANIGKNIGFLTASASRAAIHQSLAIKGNLADVTAKSASQSMAAGLFGTAVGIGLSTFLQHDATNFIMGFCVLSSIHQGCNYTSLKSVPLQHFNRHRLHLLLSHYIETQSVLGPSQVAEQERYFPVLIHDDESHLWLSIGTPMRDFCPGPVKDFEELCGLFENESYLLNIVQGRIHLVFLGQSTGDDLITGMYHAYLLRNEMETRPGRSRFQAIESSYQKATTESQGLREDLQAMGWNTGTDVTSIEPKNAYRLSIASESTSDF